MSVPLQLARYSPVLITRGLLFTGLENWYETIFSPLFLSQLTMLDIPFTSSVMVLPVC